MANANQTANTVQGRKSFRDKNPTLNGAHIIHSVRVYQSLARPNSPSKPMIAINTTDENRGINISGAQLIAAGYRTPQLLQGKTIIVDFYKKGEILLNGAIVEDDGAIVKSFTIEQDLVMLREVEKELQLQSANSFVEASLAARRAVNVGSLNTTAVAATAEETHFQPE